MDQSESNVIESALLIFIDVDSFQNNEKLENGFEEFYSLVESSGLIVKQSVKFKQKVPTTSTFITSGKLEKLKDSSKD